MINIADTLAPIVRDIRTKDERDVLRGQLGELEGAFFHSDPRILEEVLRTRLPEDLAVAMRDILAVPELKDNPESLRLFFQDFKSRLDKFSLLKLSIVFKPNEKMIDRLHEWIQQNLGTDVVLDIEYDRSMLGGARIIFSGRYKEITLAQMITDTFIKEKKTVMEMIK